MSDKLISELEEFLVPYALERFSIQNNPAAAMITSNPFFSHVLKGTLDRGQEFINTFITWACKAFIRSIITLNGAIKLNDLATVILAESLWMMDFPPYGMYSSSSGDTSQASEQMMLATEAHRWFIVLEEKKLLPGTYNRFTGVYINNV